MNSVYRKEKKEEDVWMDYGGFDLYYMSNIGSYHIY